MEMVSSTTTGCSASAVGSLAPWPSSTSRAAPPGRGGTGAGCAWQLWQAIYDNLHPGKDPPGAWEALLAPEVVDRVRRLLTARHVDIEHQLAERSAEAEELRHQCWEAGPAGRQAWFDQEAEDNRWRSRALGVKRSIAYRLRRVDLRPSRA
jgi:hypothetical protein